MTNIKNLIRNEQKIEIPFHEDSMPGFIVELNYVSRDKLQKLINKAKTIKFDRTSHTPKEEMDSDDFQKYFCDAAVVGWKGLTYEYLAELLVFDVDGVDDMAEEIPYDKETAYTLMSNSVSFDSFVSSVMKDVSFFNKRSSKKIEKK